MTPLLYFNLLLGNGRALGEMVPVTISCRRDLLCFRQCQIDSSDLFTLASQCRFNRCERLGELGQALTVRVNQTQLSLLTLKRLLEITSQRLTTLLRKIHSLFDSADFTAEGVKISLQLTRTPIGIRYLLT